jgi:Cu2+-exporting ATPase
MRAIVLRDGQGRCAEVSGRRVLVGNHRLMAAGPWSSARWVPEGTGSPVAVVPPFSSRSTGGPWGSSLADAVRETSAAAVTALHGAGVGVVMLSGDDHATARRVADQLGIDTGRS